MINYMQGYVRPLDDLLRCPGLFGTLKQPFGDSSSWLLHNVTRSALDMRRLSKCTTPKLSGARATKPCWDGSCLTTTDMTVAPLILATTLLPWTEITEANINKYDGIRIHAGDYEGHATSSYPYTWNIGKKLTTRSLMNGRCSVAATDALILYWSFAQSNWRRIVDH